MVYSRGSLQNLPDGYSRLLIGSKCSLLRGLKPEISHSAYKIVVFPFSQQFFVDTSMVISRGSSPNLPDDDSDRTRTLEDKTPE